MVSESGDGCTFPRQMYPRDLVRAAAAAILEIHCGPLVVQLSTYKAQNNSQHKIKQIVEWIMAAVGLELVDTVRVHRNMMPMILARDLHDQIDSTLVSTSGSTLLWVPEILAGEFRKFWPGHRPDLTLH